MFIINLSVHLIKYLMNFIIKKYHWFNYLFLHKSTTDMKEYFGSFTGKDGLHLSYLFISFKKLAILINMMYVVRKCQ